MSHVFPFIYYGPQILPKNLKTLYISSVLRVLGQQFELFFFPIFLYQIGQKLSLVPISIVQNGFVFIGLYFFCERLTTGLLGMPIARLVIRLGPNKNMIIGQFLYVVKLALLTQVENYPFIFILIICMSAIQAPLYSCSHFSFLSSVINAEKMGESMGTTLFFIKLAQSFIPLLAGIIILELSFIHLFIVAAFFQMVSLLILFFMDHLTSKKSVQFQFILRNSPQNTDFYWRSLSYSSKNVADSVYLLWPFFVFLLLRTIDSVGFLYFVVFFIGLLITYFSGFYIQYLKNKKPFYIVGGVVGSIWLIKVFITGVWGILTIDVFHYLSLSIFNPFYEFLSLPTHKGENSLNNFLNLELISAIVESVFWLCFMVYFTFFSDWKILMSIGFFAVLLVLLTEGQVLRRSNSKV